MNKEEAIALSIRSMEQNPRTAPFGIFLGGSFVLDSVRVFSWFESLEEMLNYLIEILPSSFDFEEQDLPDYQESIRSTVAGMATDGLTESYRAEFNLQVHHFITVDWWGSFSEITEGHSEFANRIRAGFLDDELEGEIEVGQTPVIREEQMDGFVEYLKTCGC